jgi:hypothetical protein
LAAGRSNGDESEMTDIVQRLRARKATWLEAIPVMKDAADEIERLRRQVEELQRIPKSSPERKRQHRQRVLDHIQAIIEGEIRASRERKAKG